MQPKAAMTAWPPAFGNAGGVTARWWGEYCKARWQACHGPVTDGFTCCPSALSTGPLKLNGKCSKEEKAVLYAGLDHIDLIMEDIFRGV